MFHFNSVNLSGTLTRDPEVKFTPKGTAVCQASLAINRRWKDDQGNKQEETVFVEVECWGKTASTIGDWCKKGHTIFIEGRLKLDKWTDKETQKERSKLKVVAERFHFVDKPQAEKENDQQNSPPQRPKPTQKPPPDPDLDSDDDIPFD